MKRTDASPADAIFARLNDVCCAFAGAECKLSHGAPSFHVRGKMFVTFMDHHHGDGRIAAWVKATLDDQRRLVAQDPIRFFVPPYVGVKGWVGVRLDGAHADWIELAILVESAWASVAPKRVAADGVPKRAKPFTRPKTDPEVARAALERLTEISLALPEATREREANHASFVVGKKTFAYFLDNHHGDEIISVCVRVPKGENAALAKADPKRFYLPAYMHSHGWVGVRLDVGRVDWKTVAELVAASYRSVAPKSIVEKTVVKPAAKTKRVPARGRKGVRA
jgi:hypothetical protein